METVCCKAYCDAYNGTSEASYLEESLEELKLISRLVHSQRELLLYYKIAYPGIHIFFLIIDYIFHILLLIDIKSVSFFWHAVL